MPAAHTYRAGVALLIGIGDYLHADRITPLQFATHDARSLARLLADPDVCRFPPGQVALLTDRKARRDQVVRRLSSWLPAQARGAELAVIYFAGHGVVQKIGGREEGFLLPYDADPDEVVTRGVAMSDLARWIAAVEARAVVVCLDCCHAGKVLPPDGVSLRGTTPRDLTLRPGVLEGIAGKGRFLIASCDEGQKSIEAPELRHGLFTYHLLEGIRGAGDRDGDGRVGVAELFNYVSAAVARDAREKFGLEQKPWTHSTWTEDVHISTPAAAPKPPVPASPMEHLWRSEGALAAVAAMERAAPEAGEEELVGMLRLLRRMGDPAGIPLVFRCLAHRSPAVRERAHKAVLALGWDRVSAAIFERAAALDDERLGHVLEGLAAFASHRDVVALLDRLVVVLKGVMRTRAILLLERKRLGLGLEKVAALLTEKQSPYRLEKVLGAGLFTAAYLARDEWAGLEVVVRVLRPEFAAQPVLRGHFLDLSRRSVRYVHHNLVLTREVRAFADRDVYYTVRDYVAGVTLREALEAGKCFEPPQILAILRQVLDAMTPLHIDGVPHGGVKPSNVFLCSGDRVVLGDPSPPGPPPGLDLERLAYDFRYAPPELFGGAAPGPAADFYSLGCVAYELFCGEPPFVADSPFGLIACHARDAVVPPSRRRGGWGDAVDRFVERFLAKAAADRPADIADARRALDALQQALLAPPPAAGPPPGGPTPEVITVPPASEAPAPLWREQSLADYAGRQSLMPLSGPSPMDTLGEGGPASAASLPPAADLRLPAIPGYEILGVLGRGGMGVVYKARDVRLGRLVALKMILAGAYAGPDEVARFRREAEAIARLAHPNIVQVYAAGEHDGVPYFVLEHVEGGSLARRLSGPSLGVREAAQVVELLARAVHYAHSRGIVHRDLKPANVLLTADGTPKITDFGLARKTDTEEHTRTGAVFGTPAYMAPEQASGKTRDIGPAVDVYALGSVLYELLLGRPPFRADTAINTILQLLNEEPVPPRRLRPDVPRDLELICLKCLQKLPEKRYTTAEALADDLRRFLSGAPVTDRPAGLWKRLRRLIGD
jgi:serine/threonine-protein kinase